MVLYLDMSFAFTTNLVLILYGYVQYYQEIAQVWVLTADILVQNYCYSFNWLYCIGLFESAELGNIDA